MKPVAPAAANAALPPVDKPAEAPDQINDAKSNPQTPAQVQTGTKKGKAKNAPVDKSKESTSTKKKKGLEKLNPF